MQRRLFLQSMSSAAAWAADRHRPYRVALIGAAGRGNYGHDWDIAWRNVQSVEVVAVADASEAGRTQAQTRSGAARAYAGYEEMLAKEKPEIVTICPRWTDQRLPMIRAAVEAGAHVLVEKPVAGSLPEADAIVALARQHKRLVQVGHPAAPSPVVKLARQMVDGGEIGDVLEIRARGKEDRRAGGEDLIVLGTHCFDLMRRFGGDPEWVFAQVQVDGRPIVAKDVRQGTEPIGWIAGNQIDAMFGLPAGIKGYFSSRSNHHSRGERFGVWVYGSKGAVFVSLNARRGEGWINRSGNWTRFGSDAGWERFPGQFPEKQGEWNLANYAMAMDLLAAIEERRDPVCSAIDGRWTLEMIAGIYGSQIAGKSLRFPLENRADPLAGFRAGGLG